MFSTAVAVRFPELVVKEESGRAEMAIAPFTTPTGPQGGESENGELQSEVEQRITFLLRKVEKIEAGRSVLSDSPYFSEANEKTRRVVLTRRPKQGELRSFTSSELHRTDSERQ